jgi:hypothetical protein
VKELLLRRLEKILRGFRLWFRRNRPRFLVRRNANLRGLLEKASSRLNLVEKPSIPQKIKQKNALVI